MNVLATTTTTPVATTTLPTSESTTLTTNVGSTTDMLSTEYLTTGIPTSITKEALTTDILSTENLTTGIPTCPCSCDNRQLQWYAYIHGTLTEEEKKQIIDQEKERIRKELLVDTTALSSYKREKTCADDQRASAKSVGSLGIIILLLICVFLVFSDFITFCDFIHKLYKEKWWRKFFYKNTKLNKQ